MFVTQIRSVDVGRETVVRSTGLREHSGQIAFPGGKMDTNDPSPLVTALREAQEDLIDSIIARCQALIGDYGRPWRHTGMDSEFFASMSVTSSPCP